MEGTPTGPTGPARAFNAETGEPIGHGPAVRAKFRVTSKEERWAPSGVEGIDEVAVEVKMNPVYASAETVADAKGNLYGLNAVEENRIFGSATPAGSIAMLIRNRVAAEALEIGRAYYVDFVPAEG